VSSKASFQSKLNSNYIGAKKVLNKIKSHEDLEKFFMSAISFAKQLVENNNAIQWIINKNYNVNLVFGINQIDILKEIISQADSKNVLCINYEYWSIIVYFILIMEKAPNNIFVLDRNNIFISAVLAGNVFSILEERLDSSYFISQTVVNGLFIYLRFLFSINILIDGCGLDVTEFKYWDKLNKKKIKEFLMNFNYLITTNYDKIIEQITNRNVRHLHGEFSETSKIILYQSLSVNLYGKKIDLSSVILGDYFSGKTFFINTAQLSTKNYPNTPFYYYSEILKEINIKNNSNTIVIFGLCPDNDYHIIRDLQCNLGLKSSQIIFCYFDDYAKYRFLEVYEKCIRYSEEFNIAVRNNINLSLINTQEILDKYFIKT